MTQSLRTNFTVILISILLAIGTLMLLPAVTSAQTPPTPSQQIQGSVNCGSDLKLSTGQGAGETCDDKPTQAASSLDTLIKNVINIFSAIVGAVCVIMIIIGGFRYVTSAGDSNNVGGAKNTILYAIVGLIIVAFAQIIVRFVLQSTNS